MLGTGRTLAKGTIILDKGKIAVVAEGDLPAPAGAVVIDGTGKFVTPGIIDTHSPRRVPDAVRQRPRRRQ